MKLTDRIHKRRQGKGWVVVTWDESRKLWQESREMDYWSACRAVRDARKAAKTGGAS